MSPFATAMEKILYSYKVSNPFPHWAWLIDSDKKFCVIPAIELRRRFGSMSEAQVQAIQEEVGSQGLPSDTLEEKEDE